MPFSRSISSRAAVSAISLMGWRTVVRGGHRRDAKGVSSKPTTDRSPGMAKPRRCASKSTPAAMSSLLATMALGASGKSSNSAAAALPESKSK